LQVDVIWEETTRVFSRGKLDSKDDGNNDEDSISGENGDSVQVHEGRELVAEEALEGAELGLAVISQRDWSGEGIHGARKLLYGLYGVQVVRHLYGLYAYSVQVRTSPYNAVQVGFWSCTALSSKSIPNSAARTIHLALVICKKIFQTKENVENSSHGESQCSIIPNAPARKSQTRVAA
jgi:hypothetical protein